MSKPFKEEHPLGECWFGASSGLSPFAEVSVSRGAGEEL